MADGVPPNKVYEVLSAPGGIERAIKKIKELKPHVAVWWSSGAQHAQLMKDGEVDMITGWNGRFDVVAKDGAKVAYTFNQALLDYDCFASAQRGAEQGTGDAIPRRDQQTAVPGRVHQVHHLRPDEQEGLRRSARSAPPMRRRLPSYADNAAKQLPIDLAWYTKFEAQGVRRCTRTC